MRRLSAFFALVSIAVASVNIPESPGQSVTLQETLEVRCHTKRNPNFPPLFGNNKHSHTVYGEPFDYGWKNASKILKDLASNVCTGKCTPLSGIPSHLQSITLGQNGGCTIALRVSPDHELFIAKPPGVESIDEVACSSIVDLVVNECWEDRQEELGILHRNYDPNDLDRQGILFGGGLQKTGDMEFPHNPWPNKVSSAIDFMPHRNFGCDGTYYAEIYKPDYFSILTGGYFEGIDYASLKKSIEGCTKWNQVQVESTDEKFPDGSTVEEKLTIRMSLWETDCIFDAMEKAFGLAKDTFPGCDRKQNLDMFGH